MLAAGDVAAHDADRLGQRADLDVDAAVQVEVVDRAAAVPAQHAGGVRVVDHDRRLVAIGHVADAGQRRDVAVHREDAVGDDQDRPVRAVGAAVGARLAQHLLEAVDVAMREDGARRLRQAHAVDDRGVVELVADDQVRSRR